MIRRQHIPKPSPAEQAHTRVVKQEERLRRIERLYELAMKERAQLLRCMEGETYYPPAVLHNHATHWECCELARINATRPASRICYQLPLSAYDQKRCGKYGEDCTRT